MNSTSFIELEKAALANNYEFLKALFKGDVKISSVVKGNAYGHGINEFIPLAESLGINHFSVHSADEAYQVHQVKAKSTDIMVMGYIDNEDLQWVIENDIAFFVFEFDRLVKASEVARNLGKLARIHVEIETGMNRTGFSREQLDVLCNILISSKDCLKFEGLCTHFAGAESIANHVRVQQQKDEYLAIAETLESHGLVPEFKHTCCSAASIRLPEMHFDMVRIGILQYGFWPSREIFIEYLKGRKIKEDPLRRVISWKSKVMSVKHVEMGEFIGYGTTYLAQKDTQIAIVPIGYSHGFSRSLSNQGRVLINGYRVPVIGIVNMNNMAVDISDIPTVDKGDEVTLIGKSEEVEISVSSFGELSDQLNYELLTRLPSRIKRNLV